MTGSGLAQLDRNRTLRVDTSLSVASVRFAGTVGFETLVIGNGASMTAPISGFGNNDVIDVLGIKANGLTFLSGTLGLTENGTTVDQFVFKGSYTEANFRITPDAQGGTDIHYVAAATSASPDAAGAAPNADLVGATDNIDPWTGNPPMIALNNEGEGGHAF